MTALDASEIRDYSSLESFIVFHNGANASAANDAISSISGLHASLGFSSHQPLTIESLFREFLRAGHQIPIDDEGGIGIEPLAQNIGEDLSSPSARPRLLYRAATGSSRIIQGRNIGVSSIPPGNLLSSRTPLPLGHREFDWGYLVMAYLLWFGWHPAAATCSYFAGWPVGACI